MINLFAKKLYKEKNRLKIRHFLLIIGFNKPRFYQNIDNIWFRWIIISVKLLVFGVNIVVDTSTKILIIRN